MDIHTHGPIGRAQSMLCMPSTVAALLTMSTLEIAGLVEQLPKNVVRDIRVMFNALKIEPDEYLGKYVDAKGEAREYFTPPKRECLILMSGSVRSRANVETCERHCIPGIGMEARLGSSERYYQQPDREWVYSTRKFSR